MHHRPVVRPRLAVALGSCVLLVGLTQAAFDPAPEGVAEGEELLHPSPGPNASEFGNVSRTTNLPVTVATTGPAPVVVAATCEGYCDVGQSPTGCYCDSNCDANGDCCVDQETYCAATTTTTQTLSLANCSASADDYAVDWSYDTQQSALTVLQGDTITFTYSSTHTVYALQDEQHWIDCDFNGAVYVGGNVGNSPFELCTSSLDPGTYYLACIIGSHCSYGDMKVVVDVVEIGPALRGGLVEYFAEGNLTCSTAKSNKISRSTGTTLAECYAKCFSKSECNYVLWQVNFSRSCTLFKDCSNRCQTSAGSDCRATEHLRTELTTSVGTTFAVAEGYASCALSMNNHVNSVFVNGDNITTSVTGDMFDGQEVKTFTLAHYKGGRYTVALSGSDSTPTSCFDASSFMMACRSTATSSLWNAVVSHPSTIVGYATNTSTNPDAQWYAPVETIANTATLTYNASGWPPSCQVVDNFFTCSGACLTSGTGWNASTLWGCPLASNRSDSNNAACRAAHSWFRLELLSSAASIVHDYGSSTCRDEDSLAVEQRHGTLNDCYRLCSSTADCSFFFFSTEETGSVSGHVCRTYTGSCATATLEESAESGVVYKLLESCFDGRTNQDELYVDCGGTVCGPCVCGNHEHGNALVDGGCVACTALDACPTNHFYNSTYCPGNETLNENLTYVETADDTCRECTVPGNCSASFYWSNTSDCAVGNGSVNDACQLCTTEGSCPRFHYFDETRCRGNMSEDDSCVACATTCSVGSYFDIGECDGSGSADETCQPCEHALIGNCTPGHYHDLLSCRGNETYDDSCSACTKKGACTAGFYFDATKCAGDGFSDDACQPCTTLGNCSVGFFFDTDACDGSGTTDDDTCVACTATGSCADGLFFDARRCQGNTTVDDQCQPCTVSGECAPGTFFQSTACNGSGTVDHSCRECTQSGHCPRGSYFVESNCQGQGTTDDACVLCTSNSSCSDGFFWDPERCNGTTIVDDSCAPCTTTGNCPAGFFFHPLRCAGDGDSDDSCQPCTAEGSCSVGYYFDATRCKGKLRVDDSCQPCTEEGDCPDGFYYSGVCGGTGIADSSCKPCTSSGSCPVGYYYHADGCDGTTSDADSSCAACATTCDSGYFANRSACDGTGELDATCVECGATQSCLPGQFQNVSRCSGNTTTDVSCVNCSRSGHCPIGYYYDHDDVADAQRCDGTGSSDENCSPCAKAGSCPAGQYFDATVCSDGSGTSNGCVNCTRAGSCVYGYYHNDTFCQGEGTADNSCWQCTVSGECEDGYYHHGAACNGSTTTDSSCVACSAFEACPVGYYFDFSRCDGTGSEDDSCRECYSSGVCDEGEFYDITKCQGEGAADDSCQSCTTRQGCAPPLVLYAGACDGLGDTDATCR